MTITAPVTVVPVSAISAVSASVPVLAGFTAGQPDTINSMIIAAGRNNTFCIGSTSRIVGPLPLRKPVPAVWCVSGELSPCKPAKPEPDTKDRVKDTKHKDDKSEDFVCLQGDLNNSHSIQNLKSDQQKKYNAAPDRYR